MVIYEVNLDVDRDVVDQWRGWMDAHVAELLAIDGFVSASLWRRMDGLHHPSVADAPERVPFTVQYVLESRMALEDYLEHHAPRLRRDGIDRFGGRFVASRRTLDAVRSYGS